LEWWVDIYRHVVKKPCSFFHRLYVTDITKYYSGNQIEKNEMGGACSMYGGKERSIQDFGGEI
jgi:hypothetical protein